MKKFYNSWKGFLCISLLILSVLTTVTIIYRDAPPRVFFLMLGATIAFAVNTVRMTLNLRKLDKEIEKLRKERRDTEMALMIATRDRD